MGMNNIPLEDKQTVINNLAEGKSYAESMNGTSIKSKDTIHRIAHQETNAIERKRQEYLKKIKKFGASDSRRAAMWSSMVYANKLVGKNAVISPDWQARAIALKYIDSLSDLDKAKEMILEVTDKTPHSEVDPESTEAQDFNDMFKKFINQNC